jgi:hypothetical protein
MFTGLRFIDFHWGLHDKKPPNGQVANMPPEVMLRRHA